jgi:hypothetical protein
VKRVVVTLYFRKTNHSIHRPFTLQLQVGELIAVCL